MKKIGAFLALCLISLTMGLAQEGQEIRLGTTLVNTFLTVTNKEGEIVSNLEPSDIIIRDNGVRQQITEFSRETQLPLTLALVIDRSRSVQERVALERAAAIGFLESILRKGQDRGLVVAFDSTIFLLQDFTDDVTALTSKIQNLSVAGNTAVFDAVYRTARHRFSQVSRGRKVFVAGNTAVFDAVYKTARHRFSQVSRGRKVLGETRKMGSEKMGSDMRIASEKMGSDMHIA